MTRSQYSQFTFQSGSIAADCQEAAAVPESPARCAQLVPLLGSLGECFHPASEGGETLPLGGAPGRRPFFFSMLFFSFPLYVFFLPLRRSNNLALEAWQTPGVVVVVTPCRLCSYHNNPRPTYTPVAASHCLQAHCTMNVSSLTPPPSIIKK